MTRENQVKKRVSFTHQNTEIYLSFEIIEKNDKDDLYIRMYYKGESLNLVRIDKEQAINIVDSLNRLRIEVYGN